MTSNYQVTVLGPFGRRTNIKVTPATSILQIIEEACAKQKLNSNIYDAKHLRRILDTTSTVRFSNVPNKAQLELVELSTPRKEGFVTVNLVTETGQRLISDFSSNTLLLDILNHHAKEGNIDIPDKESGLEPVIVYTMRRISAEDLATISLKSLGLLSGKCMLRYNKQDILPGGARQANVSGPLIQPKKELPKESILQTENIESISNNKHNVASIIPEVKSAPEPVVKDLITQSTSIIQTKESNDNCSSSEHFSQNKNMNEVMEQDAQSNNDIVEETPQSNNNSIDDNKIEVDDDIQEVTSSQSMDEVISTCDHKEPSIIKLGSHDAIMFNWDDAPTTNIDQESDAFYELSLNEVKKLYKEQLDKLKDMDEAPLMTKGMKELEKDSRLLYAMNRHPVTQLRICFPDRNVIQASFKPRNTIQEVMDFIRQFLDITDSKFSLYTIMPKNILDPKLSLVEADCIPNARLYYEASDNSSSYLNEETISKKSSFEGASNHTGVSQTSKNTSEAGPSRSVRPKVRPSTSTHRSNDMSTKKPKWFKLGK